MTFLSRMSSIARIFELSGQELHRLLARMWAPLYTVALDVDLDDDAAVYEGVREWLRDASPSQFGRLLRIAYTHGYRDGSRDEKEK